jgi:eukaryotic translation initiation factor 2-alpha kinase 1
MYVFVFNFTFLSCSNGPISGEGLAYIHDQNIVHRDIAPKNIFFVPHSKSTNTRNSNENVGSGTWKIGDFGLVTLGDSFDIEQTHTEKPVKVSSSKRTSNVGTIIYAAPEQLKPSPHIPFTSKSGIQMLLFVS